MKNLTVAITSFKRPAFLARALKSCRDAGIENIAVFSMCPDDAIREVVSRSEFGSVSFYSLPVDLGCNELWIQAAYRVKTKFLILLHDDDTLAPEFGGVYRSVIAPTLASRAAGFATWNGQVVSENGKTFLCDYLSRPTGVYPSALLEKYLLQKGKLSLSPVVSVLNRDVLISAAKEADQFLTHPASYLHPGMLLGTEILVYLRQCAASSKWLFVNQTLSNYGAHAGSGTAQAERAGNLQPLIAGYDVTRDHFNSQKRTRLQLDRRIFLLSTPFKVPTQEERDRISEARRTWEFHFNQGRMLDFPVVPGDLPSDSAEVGDVRRLFRLRGLLDYGCSLALPEDIVAYANTDLAFTTTFPDRVFKHMEKLEVAVAWRRSMKFEPGRFFHSAKQGKIDGGVDFVAVTPSWWGQHKNGYPDLFTNCAHWDWVFRVFAEKITNGHSYMKDGTYHQPHQSQFDRLRNVPGAQKENTRLALEYFTTLRDQGAVNALKTVWQ